ncbi:hypothetical protein ACOSP7_030183 [Xanthoceras sorbifolium]
MLDESNYGDSAKDGQKEGTSAEPFGPWLLAPVGRGRVGLGSVNRDSMNGRQNFGGICNRVGRHTGAAVNGVDEVGFKYMGRDGRYANSGAKFGSREEVRTVPNAGVSGVSKGKIGKGVDVVKGNGKVGADSRDRSEKSTNEDNGAYVSYSGGGLRFEVLDSMVEEGTPKGLIFQPKISKKNKPVLNEITNKRFATTVVPKNPIGSGKKSGKVPGSIGSKCGSIKEGISGRKNNCLGKDVSFYLKDHKLFANPKGKEDVDHCCDIVEAVDIELEDTGVLAELHQEFCNVGKVSREDIMDDSNVVPGDGYLHQKIDVEDRPFEEVASRLKEAMDVSVQ